MSITDFINTNHKLIDSSELIFFGGTFNPWHEGHTSCLNLLSANSPVIVIPDHNPYKELREKRNDDLHEIKKNLNQITKETYIFDEFYQKNEKNPSYKWLSEIRNNFPTKKISLLIGFDTFMSVDRWIQAQTVLDSIDCLYIASREDDKDAKEKQIKNLRQLSNKLELNFIGNHKFEHVSSTEIRKKRPN